MRLWKPLLDIWTFRKKGRAVKPCLKSVSLIISIGHSKCSRLSDVDRYSSDLIYKRFNNLLLDLACLEFHADPLFFNSDYLPLEFESFFMLGKKKSH